MAIINTLRSAWTARTSSRTRTPPCAWAPLLAKAAERLEAAANLHKAGAGDPADVSFLSYEAMFNCLRALVYQKGYREAGLRCLLLACENLYVRPGALDVELIHAFERAQGLKTPPAESLNAAFALSKKTLELLNAG